jgi:Flp pilus assembly protein TadG
MTWSVPLAILGRSSARLRKDRQGLAAVEFALLAVPLLMIIFAIIETSLVLVMGLSLANATTWMSRQVRVGGLVAPGISFTTSSGTQISLADFKTQLCGRILFITTTACVRNIRVDVRTLASFTASPPTSPISGTSFSDSGFCFYSGLPGQAVEVRTYYMWPIINPLLWATLSNITSQTANGTTTTGQWMATSATDVFVNEPNSSTTNTGAGC